MQVRPSIHSNVQSSSCGTKFLGCENIESNNMMDRTEQMRGRQHVNERIAWGEFEKQQGVGLSMSGSHLRSWGT